MKKLAFLFLFLIPLLGLSQVSDQDWEHDADRDVIIIKYNLNKIDRYNYYDIKISATGNYGRLLNAQALLGDIGTTKVGDNKIIEWEVKKDYNELLDTLFIHVIATPNLTGADPEEVKPDPVKPESSQPPTPPIPKQKINKTPLWIGLAGSVVVGGTLVVIGSTQVSDGKEIYETYENHLDENDDVYQDKSREDYYNDANSKYKTGRILQIAGAAVLVGGSAFFIAKLAKANKNNKTAFSITPIYNNEYITALPSGAVVNMTFRF